MGITIPCRNVLSHCLKSLEGNGFVFDKVSGIETESVYHDFPLKYFCLSIRTLCRGTVCCFRTFMVPIHRRVLRFSVENFGLSLEKIFWEPLCVLEKISHRDRDGYHNYQSERFVSLLKISVGERFCV